jgi:GT2 family glycosyltransferase
MSASAPAAVDVIIVAWNSAPDLRTCLAALPPDARAIVVDNGSGDDSARVARDHGATVVELGRNVGFAAGVNAGLEHVTAPFTLLLNPDVVVEADTIEICRRALAADEGIGVVGPNTVQPDGTPEPPAARRDRHASHIVLESLGLTHVHKWFDRQTIRDRSHDRDVDAVNGAFMLIRSDLLRALDGLDTTVFMYLEDADLCRRVRDRGKRVRFVAEARAVHAYGTSTRRGSAAAQARAYLHRLDADIEFMRRYRPRPSAGIAVAAFTVRSLLGLVASLRLRDRRLRYRTALAWTWQQRRGRHAPPVV